MDSKSGRRGGDGGGIEDEVADLLNVSDKLIHSDLDPVAYLSEEDVGGTPAQPVGTVLVAVNETKVVSDVEVGSSLDHGSVCRVADDLGVEVIDD